MSAYQPNDGCLTGNCQFCGQNSDCVLLAILQKVKNLENAIAQMANQSK
jgi:hypothetical protein